MALQQSTAAQEIEVPYVEAFIRRSANQNEPVTVLAHEIPILAEINKDHRVNVTKITDKVAKCVPRMERARLLRKFGRDYDSRQPYVETVFGKGIKGLRDTMELGADMWEPEELIPEEIASAGSTEVEGTKQSKLEPITKPVAVNKMTKAKMIKYLDDMGFDTDDKMTRTDMLKHLDLCVKSALTATRIPFIVDEPLGALMVRLENG